MYFMPRTNRWYSWAVHTKAIYRYGMVFAFWAILIVGWRYGIYAWFDAEIASERAAISQLQKQAIQLTQAERAIRELQDTLPMLRKQMQNHSPSSVSVWQQQQFNCVMDEAHKAGIQITAYTDEKEKKKSWGLYRIVQLSMNGTFEQLCAFLEAIKKSPYMIQCNQFRASRTEGDAFSASCGLKLMVAKG